MNNVSNKIQNTWEVGSTNVFADLDMVDAEEKLAKAELTFKINQIIKKRKLTQAQAANILGTDQSKISLLNRGRIGTFSIERLVKYLTLLNQDIEIVVRSKRRHHGHGSLRVVYV